MRNFFMIALLFGGLVASAAETKIDVELEQKKEIALRLVRAASVQTKSEVTVQDAYRAKGKVVIQLSESYETEESGVMCNKTIEFSKNAKDKRLNIIKIFDGLCFS